MNIRYEVKPTQVFAGDISPGGLFEYNGVVYLAIQIGLCLDFVNPITGEEVTIQPNTKVIPRNGILTITE